MEIKPILPAPLRLESRGAMKNWSISKEWTKRTNNTVCKGVVRGIKLTAVILAMRLRIKVIQRGSAVERMATNM